MTILDTLNRQVPSHKGKEEKAADVTIVARGISKDNRKAVFCFTFRNNTHKKICPNGLKLTYAAKFGIVAFRESETGWKFGNSKGNSSTKYVQVTADADTETPLLNMVGNYDLKEDGGIYYISKY